MSILAGCSGLGDRIRNTTRDDAAPFHEGDWHQYGNGSTNANRVAGGAPEPDEDVFLTTAGWPYAPPAVHDGNAYFATEGRVVVVTPDGSEQWSRQLDGEVSGTPALDPDRGRLYVPTRIVLDTDDAELASVAVLSLAEGELVDAFRVGTGRTYGVTILEGDVCARSASACVRLAPDGTERWRRPLESLTYDEYNLGDGTATQVAPAVVEDGVYVPDQDALVKLDRETGRERWRVPVDTPYAASVVDDNGVIQTGWQETVAVDHSGDVRWRRDLHSIAAAAAADSDVYITAQNGLYELDAESGETNWEAHLSANGTAAPVVTDDAVLVATSDIVAYRRSAGGILTERDLWQSSVPVAHTSEYSSPVVAAGHVFAAGARGLVALRSNMGD